MSELRGALRPSLRSSKPDCVTRTENRAAAKTYIARRAAKGKTARDAQRCLKRTICRQIFKLLEHPNRETPRDLEDLPSPA